MTAIADQPITRTPLVRVTNTTLHIDQFTETDPEVVTSMQAATDPVAAIHTRLHLGTRVLRLANTTGAAESVRAEVDRMTRDVSAAVGDAVARVAETTTALLDDETGRLPAALAAFGDRLTNLLGDTFDASSRDGAIAKIEKHVAEMLAQAGEQQLGSLRRIINPDAEDSPLGRFRNELVKTVTDQVATVLIELRSLSQTVAGQAAAAQVFELTTQKGRTFEDQLHALVEQVAIGYGDLASQTGREPGPGGTMKGDELVVLNPDHTRGARAAYIFEVKDRKLSLRKTLAELDAAMANREAAAGVAVFSSQDRAPTSVSFTPYGNQAILVLDKNDPDPQAVRLACMWARWLATRGLGAGDLDSIDLDRIATQIDNARHALSRASTLRRAHSAARNSIGQASSELDALVEDLNTSLNAIGREIRRD